MNRVGATATAARLEAAQVFLESAVAQDGIAPLLAQQCYRFVRRAAIHDEREGRYESRAVEARLTMNERRPHLAREVHGSGQHRQQGAVGEVGMIEQPRLQDDLVRVDAIRLPRVEREDEAEVFRRTLARTASAP